MPKRSRKFTPPRFTAWLSLLMVASGCISPGQYAKVVKERDAYSYRIRDLEREVAQRDAQIASLKSQVETLAGLGPDRPIAALVPESVEIASRSGGADFDGQPGDDGITIYLRPRDADGDAIKAIGRVTIELLDTSEPGSPKVLRTCKFDDLEELRKLWFSRFATQHYNLRCPFEIGAPLPESRKLLAVVTFLDLITGKTLKAHKEVSFTRRTDG